MLFNQMKNKNHFGERGAALSEKPLKSHDSLRRRKRTDIGGGKGHRS